MLNRTTGTEKVHHAFGLFTVDTPDTSRSSGNSTTYDRIIKLEAELLGERAHKELVRHIRDVTGLNGGAIVEQIAGGCENIVRRVYPDAGSVDIAARAKVVFDKGTGTFSGGGMPNSGLAKSKELSDHIKNVMGIPGGPLLQVFAKIYRDEAKKDNPSLAGSTEDIVRIAKELFDKDPQTTRLEKYEEAKNTLARKKEEKAATRGTKRRRKSTT